MVEWNSTIPAYNASRGENVSLDSMHVFMDTTLLYSVHTWDIDDCIIQSVDWTGGLDWWTGLLD